MALLDDILKRVPGTGPTSEGAEPSLASAALALVSNAQGGGLSGLAQQFAARGLGHIVSSWIGTGQNLPVSPEQLQSVLGSEQVQAIAARAGISPEAAKSGLAQILPGLIDGLTPNGEVPQGDLMAKGMELLKEKMFS